MLRRLSVENYALIDKLEMELGPHLNIITGETGAGKSILLGALGLLLGAKNDGQAMKDATRNCTVEGTFDLAGSSLEAFFAENDLDYAPETTLTRMITPAGKSRAFVNDVPVQLAQLRELGARLLDIHSQHQNLILSSEEFRTSALDTVAANGELLTQYAAQYARLTELRRRLAALREEAANGRRDEEWLRFQTEELTSANLRPGEQAELEEELAVLENADRIGEVLTTLRNALDADETGVLTLLKNSENDLTRIREHFPAAGEYAARLHSVLEELKDIDNAVAADSERLDADPERLAKLAARLDALYALQQKHRVASEAELIAARDCYAAQLAAIVHGDEEIAAAEKELDAAAQKAGSLADRLHKARAKAAPAFEKQILATLAQLGMPETVFRVALTPLPDLGRTGGDGVAFLFSANRNATPQSVERIASGGELSRLRLCMLMRRALAGHAGAQIPAGPAHAVADGHLRRDRHGRLRAHRRRHGRDHRITLRDVAGRGHHPPAAGGVERRSPFRGLQTRRAHRHHAPDGRGAHHRDRQDALRQPHHRCRHSPGTHSAGQITAHATTRRPERTFCPAHFMNSVY